MNKIELKNRKSQKIVGILEKPTNILGTCIIQHGYGGFKEQDHMQIMQDVFLKHEFQTFNFDATNSIGESDGEYEKATLGLHYEDFEDVASWVQDQDWFTPPLAIIGHSMGGYSVARYAEDYPDKVGYCLPIAPVVSGQLTFEAHEAKHPEEFTKWKETGMLEKESSSRPGYIKRQPWSHMEERLSHDLIPNAEKLTMPLFLYVGTEDTSIPPTHVKKLVDAIPGENKTYVVAEGAPHTYRTDHDLRHLRMSLDEWIGNQLNQYDARKALLIAVNPEGQFLIQDRRGHKKPDWGYFGGGIDGAETSLEAVIRESKEELDLDLTPEDLAYMGESFTLWEEWKIMRYLYLYKTDQKEFTVLEGKGAHWMNANEVRKKMEDADRFDELVKKVEQYK